MTFFEARLLHSVKIGGRAIGRCGCAGSSSTSVCVCWSVRVKGGVERQFTRRLHVSCSHDNIYISTYIYTYIYIHIYIYIYAHIYMYM